MANTYIIKNVQLIRSEDFGYGFSILGGAGSKLPPIIYDIIDGSPAFKSNQLSQGDVIWQINGKEVLSCTTKEVLNHLRLSPNVLDLKLKTDTQIQEKLKGLKECSKNSDLLREAVTQDDLVGVSQIVAKKSEIHSGNSSIASSISLSPLSSSSQKRHELPKNCSESFQTLSDNGEKSDESSCNAHKKPAAKRTFFDSSPTLSEEESEIESLHSFHYSPKAVDMPSVVRLAKRLYTLEGFKKSDVSRHLSKNNDFSKAVADEYLHYYEFRNKALDVALRNFLDRFSLTGETQERERVLVHFSKRYLECNPGTFNSQDAVHTLTCAIMLLNTDLHSQNIGRKMTCSEFINNLDGLNDGENFASEVLKLLYEAIKKKPLQWAIDDEPGDGIVGSKLSRGHSHEAQIIIGSNPFLTTPLGSGVIYKKGYIMRKCCMEPNGKRTVFGKRSWKMWFCVIQDLVMYLHKDEQCAGRGPLPHSGQNAVRLHHALANQAHDYCKKEHVFRLQTADQAEYLLQTSGIKELQAWIDAINFVAASLSAPPMPVAVGSQDNFQRPLLPCSATKFNIVDQLEDHIRRLALLEKDLDYHRDNPPDKTAKSGTLANYKENEIYLASEIRRYQTYVNLLHSRFEASDGPPSIVSTTISTINMHDLPVFEVKNVNGESDDGRKDEPPSVIPPPIPERPISGDRFKFDERISCKYGLKELPSQNKDMIGKEFKGELLEIMNKEKLYTKVINQEGNEICSLRGKNAQETQINNLDQKVNKIEGEELTNDDPRIGTLGRLKALFKFSKLNRTFEEREDNKFEKILLEENGKELKNFSEAKKNDVSDIGHPPPLPPKPASNSPIRLYIGTRIDI